MRKKLCCILMLTILLLNSSIMLIISEAVEAIQSITEEKIKALAEINLIKYENYDTTTENSKSGSKGLLVQFNLKTGIEYAEDEEYNPIQKTETNIALPWIGKYKPTRVEVIIKSTQATNGGKDAKYEYHSSTGILSIVAENDEYSEKIEGAKDEYEIICIYGSECYTENEERNIRVKVGTYETLKNEEKKEISTEKEEKYTCKDTVGGIITTENETEDVYDGYIKANAQNSENKYETTYKEKLKIMVSNKEITEKIEIKETSETALYTETSINKEQIKDILGEKGRIEILDEASNVVKVINKDSEANEDGKIKLTYENRTQNLTMHLNNVEKEGIIEVENTRVIEPTAQINDNTISTQIKIKGINTITTETENEEIVKYEREEENNIQIKPAVSNMEFSLDNNVFANIKPNSTNIRITLRTDSPEYSLFKNPRISIELPEEVEKVDLKTPEIMYDNKVFNILSSDVATNENGNKIINIQLQGEQTSYNQESLIKGVNIVVPIKISLIKKLENKTQNIKFTYSNDMTSTIESKETEITLLNKIVNNYAILSQENVNDEKTTDISVTKEISDGNKKEIYEGQVQKITLTIQNNTNKEIANINIQDEIPNEFIYMDTINNEGYHNGFIDGNLNTYEKKIEKLQANKTLTFEYYVRVKISDELQGKTVTTKAKATIDGNSEIFESNLTENIIKASKVQIDMVSATDRKEYYLAGNKIDYIIKVKNITNETLTRLNIVSTIPEESSFYEALYLKYDEEQKCHIRIYSDEYINNNYDENNKTVTWTIDTLKPGEEAGVLITETLNEMENSADIRKVKTTASVKIGETEEYFSNTEEINQINKGTCDVKLTTDLEDKYVYEGDQFAYIASITNTGNMSIYDAIMTEELPKGLKGIRVEYSKNGGNQILYFDSKANISFSLQPGETFTAKIFVEADDLADGVEKLEVTNLVKVSGYSVKEMNSNEITTIILKKKTTDPTDPDNPDPDNPDPDNPDPDNPDPDNPDPDNPDPDNPDPDNPNPDTPDEPEDPSLKEYNISGLVWIDENKNGSRDNNESFISGIKVNLYDENGKVVTDSNGNRITVTTDNNGKYSFSKLEKRNYIIAFLYNNKEYKVTEYQKDGVEDNRNSDAMEMKINENGEEITVGLTDIIKITNSDISNIDMGLIKNGIFDLKLEKTISKVIVQDNKKTKTYEYNTKKNKIAKVEIDRKTANNTNIVIEYEISVTNEGEIAGYAQEIIDYMPKELDFNSELNNDWYLINGNLVTTSLSNSIIKPGETATLKLILTKKLTEKDFTTITNTAEISKDYNESLINDNDSTPGNKVEGEDDISTVKIIVGIKTGKAVTYTVFTICLISIIGVGIYLIKSKILRKEENDG